MTNLGRAAGSGPAAGASQARPAFAPAAIRGVLPPAASVGSGNGSLIVMRQDAQVGAEPVQIARAVGVKPGRYRRRSAVPETSGE